MILIHSFEQNYFGKCYLQKLSIWKAMRDLKKANKQTAEYAYLHIVQIGGQRHIDSNTGIKSALFLDKCRHCLRTLVIFLKM